MIKYIFVFAFSMFSISGFSRDWSLGPRIGVNLCNYVTESHGSLDEFKLGYQLGGYFNYSFSEKISGIVELQYSNRGDYFYYTNVQYFYDDQDRPISQSTTIRETHQQLNYLDVPLLVRFFKGFGIIAGVQPSFLLSAKTKTTGYEEVNSVLGKTYETINEEENNKDQFNKFDVAFVAGFEHQFKFGLNYGLRASYGFLDVLEDSNESTNNVSIQLILGWGF